MATAHTDVADRAQDERYPRLMAATRDLATQGYDAVSMRKVAEATRLSLATVYQFCPSKDCLIAEAHAGRMEDLRASVARRPPRAKSARLRVLKVVGAMVDQVKADEDLHATLMRAIYALDPNVAKVRAGVGMIFRELIDTAIGDEDIADRAAIIGTLGNVIGGAVFEWLHHRDTERLRSTMEDAVNVLFD